MMIFKTEGMSCGHCVASVTQAIHNLDTQAEVQVSLETQEIRVATQKSVEEIAHAISDAGYPILEQVVR